MKGRDHLFFFIIGLSLCGCVSGSHLYTPPLPGKVENSILVNKTVDEVWAGLMAKLEQDSFAIETIDKAAGRLSLSYNGDPEAFVDCGIVKMTVNDFRGERSYQFPSARQNVTFESTDKGNLYLVKRNMNLAGAIEVLIEGKSPHSTQVSVTCSYLVTKNSEVTLAGGSLRDEGPINGIDSLSFTTGGSGSFSNSIGACNPTHALERRILSLAQ
jgi:hypothetical protein